MTDLLDRLAALRVEPTATSEDALAGDVRRGRRALARRRASRIAAGSVLLVAVGGTTGVIVDGQRDSGDGATAAKSPAPNVGHSATPSSGGIRLVDYTGDQKPGFVVEKVPEGYVLQGSNAYSLDIARPGDHSDLSDFEHKVVVMLQSQDVKFRATGTAVSINGNKGYLRKGDAATELEYLAGGRDVLIQAWDGIGLTDAQLVELARGVTVTSQAQAGVG